MTEHGEEPRGRSPDDWPWVSTGLLVVAAGVALGVALFASRSSLSLTWDLLPFVVAVALTSRLVVTRRRTERADWVWATGLAFALTVFLAFGAIEAALVVLGGTLAGALLDRYASQCRVWGMHGFRTARTVLGILAGGAVAGSAITDSLTRPGDDDLAHFIPFLGVYLLVQIVAIAVRHRTGPPPGGARSPVWLAQPAWSLLFQALAWEAIGVVAAAALAVVIDTVGLRLDYWVACLIAFALLFGVNRLLDLNAQLQERNAELRQAMTELRTLNAVGQVLNATFDVDRLCVELAAQLGRWSRADAIVIALIDPARTRVRIAYHAYGGVRQPERFEEMPEVLVGPPTSGMRHRAERERIPGDGIVSQVLASRRPVVGSDTERFPLVRPDGTALPPDRSGVRQFHSAVGVPLQVAGELIGVIALKTHRPDAFDEAQVALLGRIGNQAALAMRNAEIVAGERTSARARQDFLTVVSHELRTPITSISGYAQLLARRLAREARSEANRESDSRPDPSAVGGSGSSGGRPVEQGGSATTHAEMVGIISQQSHHLGRLVDDLVTLSGLGRGNLRFEMRLLDLSEVVAEAVEAARLTLDQPASLILQPSEALMVNGERWRLREVFDNLIGNAIIYSPPGALVEIWLGERGAAAEVRITDHGRGIPMRVQAHLFEPFYRGADEEGELKRGLGLGLSISREIVTAHGGTISVLSDVGAGATFIVRLHLAQGTDDSEPTVR